ncbi:MAG: VOC family protein [Acidimicrobiales bacterium]|nr:VOC family protein [Hyphomonadaceae bacterium]RZV41109.1 MAG: VOC family protein [Acidimicrobiales bacterium]
MQLGNFSSSLVVKDIKASKAFYEKLGFKPMGGDEAQGWLILNNNNCIIGLFQGMFERNMLTFNPGWAQGGGPLDSFTDVRELEADLREAGIDIVKPVDADTSGPGSLMITDPDGNPILIDQHV